MISKQEVSEKIDKAERAFLQCWNILVEIKKGSFRPERFFKFQPKLALSIYRLGSLFHQLADEENRLLSKKAGLNKKWFGNRLKLIKQYQEATLTAIAIGKRLGDYFAWFIYHRELDRLIEHSRNQAIKSPPRGTGAMGELHFAKKWQRKEYFFFLHHGITSLLRLGDVSIFDLRQWRLAGIGELKSRKESARLLSVNMLIAPADEDLMKKYLKAMDYKPSSKKINFNKTLDQRTVNKLGRQLTKIRSSLNVKLPNRHIGQEVISNQDKFLDLMKGENSRGIGIELIGESQVLIRYQNKGRTLSHRLFSEPNPLKKIDYERITAKIKSLVFTDPKFNYLYTGFPHNPVPNKPHNSHSVPLFWRGIDPDIVKDLVFHKTKVMSLINAGPLFKSLNDMGFETTVSDDGKHITTIHKERHIQLEGLWFFINLVLENYFSEESVISLIKQWLTAIYDAKVGPSTRVELNVREIFFDSKFR